MTSVIASVIIANYNRVELLEEAILSVLDQTFQNFELIIWDDGSHDHSLQVIEAFKEKHPDKIRSFTHEGHKNKGIITTYMNAVNESRGKYVAFLEHDDRWSPTYLESKVDLFEKYPEVGVVFSPYRIVSTGWFGKDMILRQWLLRLTIKSGRPFDNFPNLLQSNNIATFSCFMTRRELIDELPLPGSGILAFDWWMLTQLSTRCLFFYDNSSHTHWRWSRQSTIGKQRFREHKEAGCDYMELMYRQVNSDSGQLPADKGDTFRHYNEEFSYFLDYYRNPGLLRFGKFFIRAPIWALAATASLAINFLKFR